MDIPEEYLPRVGAGREELITFYSWDFEDAKKAQNEWDKDDHQPSGRGPFFRWVAAIELIELAEQFKETGDNKILLQTISICALNDFAIPQWCAASYLKSFRDVWHHRVRTWDEAFGKPNKGQMDAKRQKREKRFGVYCRATEIIDNAPKTPIDRALFDRVGQELGISGSLAEKYYYSVKDDMPDATNAIHGEIINKLLEPYSLNKD